VSQDTERSTEKDGIALSVPDLEAITQKAFVLGRYAGIWQLASYLRMMHSKNCQLTVRDLDEAVAEVNSIVKWPERNPVIFEDGEKL